MNREGVPCTRASDTRKHWAQAGDAKEGKKIVEKQKLLIGLAQSRQARKEKLMRVLNINDRIVENIITARARRVAKKDRTSF